jgi:hypothetical protein
MVLPHVVRNTIAACILANTLPQIVAAVLTVCCIPKWRTGRWCRKGPGWGVNSLNCHFQSVYPQP